MQCAVAAIGLDDHIQATNPAWDRIVQTVAPNQPAKSRIADLFPGAGNLAQDVLARGASVSRRALPLAPGLRADATWWDVDLVPHPDAAEIVIVTARDVTDHVLARREAEEARQALEPIGARLHLAQDLAGIGTWEWDAAAARQAWSRRQFDIYGLDPDVMAPPSFDEWIAMLHPDDRPLILASMSGQRRDAPYQMEFRIRRADTGAERWLLSLGRATELAPDGRVLRLLGVNLDITERRNKQSELKQSNALLRLAADAAGVYAWAWDIGTGEVIWADGLDQALGLPPGGFAGTVEAFRMMVHPDDAPSVEDALRRAIAGETPSYRAMFRMIRADGTHRWTETSGTVVRDDHGQPVRVVGMDHDVTGLKTVEASLRERERQQSAVARLGQFALGEPSAQSVMDEAIRTLTATLGVEFAKVLECLPSGKHLRLRAGAGWTGGYVAGETLISSGRQSQAGYTLLQDAGPVIVEDLHTETRFNGPPMLQGHGVVSGMSVIIRGGGAPEHQQPYGVLGVHTAQRRVFTEHDIRFLEAVANLIAAAVQREHIEAQRSESEAQFRALAEAVPQMIYASSPQGFSQYKNQRWFDYSGQTPEEAHSGGWMKMLHPDDHEGSVTAWKNAITSGLPYEREHRLRGRDGQYRWFLSRAVPQRGRPDGEIIRWLGTSTDISDLVSAREEAARLSAALETRVAERTKALTEAAVELQSEMRRRQDIQAALMQSQKLEALGQLTAGVARDFNNVLSAIQGSLELIEKWTDEPKVRSMVSIGMNATRRGRSLTRQLLDFGRSESLIPAVLNVKDALNLADEMIGHAIGASISRSLNVQHGVWPILTDGNQLEIALLNLAINARDAMPDGGHLTLTARNLKPPEQPETLPFRDYVSISVRDSGHGMPPDVAARALEPFFTTKPQGKGTGLGLPMVHAFALRSGGCLRIDSREGHGTTVEIVLPRASVTGMERSDAGSATEAADRIGRRATILVVEDDDQVRQITVGFLRDQGYTVIEAPNAEAAVVLSHSIEELDLLLTDVVMPGAEGPVLAARMRGERPDLPVLFISGFVGRDDLASENVLLKPFTGADLIRAIRRRLRGMQDGETSDGGLLRRLKNPALAAAYLFWRASRNGNQPPRMTDLDWGGLPEADHAFTASVDRSGNSLGFQYLRIGRALTARLGRPLAGTTVPPADQPPVDDEVLGSLESAYRRCARTLAPSYEYAKYDFGDGSPIVFERLILPVSDDGESVSHLVGMALFTGEV